MSSARPDALRLWWDVDAPATLAEIEGDATAPLRRWLPDLDAVVTYGGGPGICSQYVALGASRCVPIYNAVDPDTHFPVPPDRRFEADLAFLGNRLPDRERRVFEFLIEPARRVPGARFLLGGAGWEQAGMPTNLRTLGHVSTRDHNGFNATPRAVLNINRDSMAERGFSPPTRIFEAAARRRLPDHRRLGGHRGLSRAGGRDPGGPRRPGRRRADAGSRAGARPGDRPQGARENVGRAYLRPSRDRGGRAAPHAARRQAEAERGMTGERLRIVFIGLTLSSSWGNGHATTYRALLRGLAERGYEVTFLERDMPWYAANRDLPDPDFCRLVLYDEPAELAGRHAAMLMAADAVIVGSYVPDGAVALREVLRLARGIVGFYDIDTPVTLAALEGGNCSYLTRRSRADARPLSSALPAARR